MIFENDLTIYHNTTEVSKDLQDYQRDSYKITLGQTDKIYIGLYKPFNSLYVELIKINESPGALTARYGGTDLPFFDDQTNNLTRSGFLKWKKPDDWNASVINGDNLFWIELSGLTTELEIRAINILFSDDNDLKKELQSIEKYLAQGQISFAPTHQTVRDDIVQTLRNKGKSKASKKCNLDKITKWDLLDISEVNLASKYFVLEKIFWQASGAPGDKFSVRQREAKAEGDKAFDLFFLSLDENDSGKDPGQMNVREVIYVERI